MVAPNLRQDLRPAGSFVTGERQGLEQVGAAPAFHGAMLPYVRISQALGQGELMLACWRRGARCAVHDHGSARGAVRVVAGWFEEEVFTFEAGHLRLVRRRRHGPGQVIPMGRGTIHRMRAPRGGITLHAYEAADRAMRIFDPQARVTWLARGGAWLPPSDVLGVERWADAT